MTDVLPPTDPTAIISVGDRVRLLADVERYPHFIAGAGLEGVVVSVDCFCVAVLLDQHVDGAEDWGNEVLWSDADFDRLGDELEVLS